MATLQEELEARHRLDAMLADFERKARTATTNPGGVFRDVLNSTPGLREQYERAVKEGHLIGIEVEIDRRFNGSYDGDSRKLRLAVGQLNEADPSNPPDDRREAADFIRYTAGHEIDHALSRERNAQRADHLRAQVAAIARGPSPHDFTAAVKEYNEGSRAQEARAEIAGFNAVAAQLKRDNPGATLADLYERDGGASNYIESDGNGVDPVNVRMKPGFHIKPDLQLDSDKSLEAMAKTFYDGTKGYPARNIDWAFGQIYLQEAMAQKANPGRPPPEMTVNVKALGADIQLPLGFKDSSPTHDKPVPPSERPALPDASDPSSQDHTLLEKIRVSVRDLEQSFGKPWDAQSERMSAAALSLAVGAEFNPGDDVRVALNRPTAQSEAGEVLFVYREGRSASPDPAANVAHMPVAQALASSAAERYQQAQAMRETQAVEQQRGQEAAQQALATEGQSQSGPKMHR